MPAGGWGYTRTGVTRFKRPHPTAHRPQGAATPTGTHTDLANEIAPAIRDRTGGRLVHLRVAIVGGVVTVSGVAPPFYLKQLALVAARAALRGSPLRPALEIAIHAR